MTIPRRNFLSASALAAVGAAALPGAVPQTHARSAVPSALPNPASSGIDHIVVVMMENRSFDHFLGWLPGANGKQDGFTFIDRYGIPHGTHHLSDYQGCSHPDPDHSYEGGLIAFNNGKCDGWLRAGDNDDFAVGYYTSSDLAFWAQAAPAWTVCDNYFAAVMAETYPNRFYQHAAQTDRIHNSSVNATIPTIWDRLAAAGVSGKYYYSDVPFIALWGTKYMPISAPYATFLSDCAAGTLPSVSFVDPRFVEEGTGTSGDDHPHADVRSGELFLNEIYSAVTKSPAWSKTLLIINFDEWGGFYDHVAPATAPDVSQTTSRRGFRVPAMLVSPYARRGAVASGLYDHTSILKAIEWRWNLPALTPRDANATNIAEVLDFSSAPNLSAPTFLVPTYVAGAACTPLPGGDPEDEWHPLKNRAIAEGWKLS
ncbi:alkaline phosphatase family protein [Sinomonas sp. ASV322]|uniref:alkaline phosphatase family protein n=1 Tax=Sinomonas sp. ASV322 TaxID=3041920 RepID=UPI0027DDB9E9|nr:alkaline phosphatase family protein [Sinomonas sp. ASV322]MDQ4503158.1 alkaline phosphatase family protein [Sinomonas sp. ASV322]